MSEEANTAPPPQAEDRLSLLWRRVCDHKIVQWTIAYVALAYGIQHGITLTSEAYDWPHAVTRVSMTLLILVLPITITLAWYHGARASRRISGAELSLISILLLIGSMLFYVVVRPEQVALRPALQQASIALASAPRDGAISIAVLPFANMSGDAGQEFFSDGMTEEITAALAQVPGLRVLGRTSAFQFKGQNKDLRNIGQALGATHLIEGSVRKAGNRVRITAQLVRANDDSHIWAQSYDRELNDVFAIQEDIAQAIAAALRVPLGLQQGGTLVRNRTDDLESYQQYLLARSQVRARGTGVAQAVAILEPLVARNPNYAPAWALLALAYYLTPNYSLAAREMPIAEAREFIHSTLAKEEMAAQRAIELDPKSALGYSGLAEHRFQSGKWNESFELFRKAVALDPTDSDILQVYSQALAAAGRLKQAVAMREQIRALEPLVDIYNIITGGIMELNGQGAAAIPMLAAIRADAAGGSYRNVYLARAYAAAGRYQEAADTLLLISGNQVTRQSVEDAARLIRAAPAQTKSPDVLPHLTSELNFVYAHIGAPERTLEGVERDVEFGFVLSTAIYPIWLPQLAPVRKTARFKNDMRRIGLVAYWQASGWPDLCHPTTGDDFECS